jgi:hypothetical protein
VAGFEWDVLVSLAESASVESEDAPMLLRRLRTELLELDVAEVLPLAAGAVPPAAKSVSAVLGMLGVRLGGVALKAVALRAWDWVTRSGAGTGIEISIDGDVLKLTNPTTEQQEKLFEVWLVRHAPDA